MIEARGLSKRYGDTVAVDALTFDISPGMVTGFLGPNGAGKSTTMRMILGLDHPSAGSVLIDGRRYRDLDTPMHEVGALLDAGAVNGRYTARQYLRWMAQAGGLPRGRAGEVLREVGLVEVADRRLGGYSLGMAQRLGIAAALLGDPATLLFDEPMNGLDPDGIRWIRTLLQRFAAEGRTVVVSSHLMHEMEATADHVLVIGRGRLIADTSIAEFTQHAAGGHVRVLSPDAAALGELLTRAGAAVVAGADGGGGLEVTGLAAAAIGDLAAQHGLRLHELVARRASLEAAFMQLTRDSVEYTPQAVS